MTTLAAITAWEKTLLLTRFALEKKAYDLVVLEVRELTSIADYFILCSGRSDRQVQSIAQGLDENGREEGFKPFAVEGMQRGHWVLMDFSDVIVHVFYEPVREFYDLDGLWGHAPRAKLPEAYAKLVDEFQLADEQLS
ncbi:MAG: ribosome silencing factor [Deltaproteobacteria bacterium]|jgi:ribosome-associated protein|nr:MAG: ribosome silencing factor [Deltaproteobacteria bacterium]